MTRNQIIIIVALVILIAVILLIFKLLAGPVQKPAGQATIPTSTQQGGTVQFLQNLANQLQPQPTVKLVPKPQAITKDIALSPFFANGYLYYFDKKTRQINYLDSSGQTTQLAALKIVPKEIFWSYATSSVLVLDQNSGFYFVQGGSTTTQTGLANVAWASFEPGAKRIAVHNLDLQNNLNNIGVANLNDLSQSILQKINLQDIRLSWVTQGKIALWENPSADIASPLFLLTFNQTNKGLIFNDLTEILPEATGLSAIFSPDGKYGLVSFVSSQGNISDALVDLTGKVLTNFDFSTFSQKCSFSQDSKYLICAVPRQTLRASDIDSWQRDEEVFDDKFIMVDLAKMKEIDLSDQTLGIDAADINLDQQNNQVFFLSRKDKLVYSWQLPQGVLNPVSTSTATSSRNQ